MRNGINPGIGPLKGNHQSDGFCSGSFYFSFTAEQQQVFPTAPEKAKGAPMEVRDAVPPSLARNESKPQLRVVPSSEAFLILPKTRPQPRTSRSKLPKSGG